MCLLMLSTAGKIQSRNKETATGKTYRFDYSTQERKETINYLEFMEEKKMQMAESGSLYMTLDAFYRPCI